ncbi:lysophospholipid acyltransferase family protein [Campylobacter sp.]|uniref:lysophospholipid acyltransferase family protein n=1 Tax=Campylobacter sp. TaxID=205 RepID=UPI0026DB284D|nr:lysophospholipid acyltransferase family protein [Campylobacter sp.]MDO4674242.1 lysophospholipid acyltransferase family protein [Campylobacter sp.]
MGKSFKKKILLYSVFILQWLIFLTCLKKYLGEKIDDAPNVILFWHGRLALMPFAFRHFGTKNKRAYVMISHHKDGENIARLIKFYGLDAVRGSTFRGANAALKAAFKVLEARDDIVITPDGPRGPYHSIADGAIVLAQKKGVKIRILNYEASRFWEFKSWDRMILPKPFSRIVYSLSEPLSVANLDKEEAKAFLWKEFEKIYRRDNFKDKK